MATTKITNLKSTTINTKNITISNSFSVNSMNNLNLTPKKKVIIKSKEISLEGEVTLNGDILITKKDLDAVLEQINALQNKEIIIREDIKELREDVNDIKDYNIDKPGTQDMDGNTTFYINTAEDITTAINNAATGDEIKLRANVSVGDTGGAMVIDGVNVIFDLNKQTLTSGNSNNDTVRVTNGIANIKGGFITTNDPYDNTHSTTLLSANENGTIILDGITINAVMNDPVNKGQFGIGVFENGNLIVNDANITVGWYCITGNGSKTNSDALVVINNGVLTSTVDYAIYHPDPSTLIINDGTITGGAGAVSMNNGNIIINGGTLKTTGDGDTGDWNDGTSGQTPAVINLNGKYGAVNCEINGGTFIAMNNAPIVITGTKYPVNISIKGGRFSQQPNAEWIAEGYIVSSTPDEQGFYVVSAI